ncbi:MAG: elongation factor G [Syntrophomonadaceae bacterium]|nr:elongation factor G [Syntrophomonadaceae bacterium]
MRNIGIIAHIDAGKTTTTERILYFTGRTYKIGETHNGESVMDYLPYEKERGITITSAATSCTWKGMQINLVDTPGHVDFTAEVERSLRVLDGAVAIFCGKGGVEPQSETVWRQADKYQVPRIAYVNKLDAVGADYFQVVDQMKKRLGANPLVINLPVFQENNLIGLIDLISLKCFSFSRQSGEMDERPIPDHMEKTTSLYRQQLLEALADYDDELMELYLENEMIPDDLAKHVLRAQTISGNLVPVLCGSSYRNIGVQSLLDAIVDYLPAPQELDKITAVEADTGEAVQLTPDETSSLAGLVFKIVTDRHVGKLAFIRVYSGQLVTGGSVYNATKQRWEHIGRLLKMHANHREEVAAIKAGDIGAIIGLKDVGTGDTLSTEENPVLLENIDFPEPVISIAIEPKKKMDQIRVAEALSKISAEDPTFKVTVNPETGQTLISGMGELHLEVIAERLNREFKVEANLGQPQVAYKETITRAARGECRYVKQTGGRGQYAHVKLRVEPSEEFSVEHKIVGGAIPREYLPAVENGIREAVEEGPLKGYPLINLKVTVLDGSYHEVDSSELAFKMAGSLALKDALRNAGPKLLEPVMKLEITTPEEFTSSIINNINSKRGRLESMDAHQNIQIVKSLVPLAELFGYSTSIRSITQGRAGFSMQFSHYEVTGTAV